MIMPTRSDDKSFLAPRSLRAGILVCGLLLAVRPLPGQEPSWPQWGRNPQHTASAPVLGQPFRTILADIVYDPFVPLASAEHGGDLLAHYPVPLVDGEDIYMEFKTGRYVACVPPSSGVPFPCGSDAWDTQIWNVTKLSWRAGALVTQWTFASDWKPEPDAGGLFGWEPVFDPMLANGFLYVPGLGGTVHKVSLATGVAVARLNPFTDVDPTRYVAGGLAADSGGHVVYNAIQLNASDPWGLDAVGGWLVRIGPDDAAAMVSLSSLVSGAPGPADPCLGTFSANDLPWPPSSNAVPPSFPCGSQRPGLNVVPAIAPDGTIYTVSRAHFSPRYGHVVAVRPDLTPAWSASLRGILNDGCGVIVPIGTPDGCREGAARGVDPATNDRPAGRVVDLATSSPVVLPDGAILYGANTSYNYSRGHLFKFSATGDALATYDFGWDITPAVFAHGSTYSIVIKDNHYGPPEDEHYDITSLDANLDPEWMFLATNTQSCARQPGGAVTCVDDHPNGFEWCVNQPAVDSTGITYANSEDGFLYAIGPDGQLRDSIFLNLALGAAYTPLSLGGDGRIYSQNNGHLFAVGMPYAARESPVRPSGSHTTRDVVRP